MQPDIAQVTCYICVHSENELNLAEYYACTLWRPVFFLPIPFTVSWKSEREKIYRTKNKDSFSGICNW